MARSAERTLGIVVGAVALSVAASGCVSTQQKAKWNQIANARILASQTPTVVRRGGRDVRVTRVTLLHDGPRVALVVRLRNTTTHPVNDIPISVGTIAGHGTPTYLNRASNLDYFQTHVAEIPARATATWVFTGRRRDGLSGRPFAVAGTAPHPPITVARTIPNVAVAIAARPGPSGRRPLRVTITNHSSVPQPDLHVYAVALAAGHYAAAGSASVSNLNTGDSKTLKLDLVGRPRGAAVQVRALPTLFQ